MRKPLIIVAAAAVAVAVLAGCNSSDDSEKATDVRTVRSESQQERVPSADQENSSTLPAAGNGSTLNAVSNPELGDIVVDAEGFTLYRFDKDTANPSASNCNGECATAWPPALTSGDWKDVTLNGVAKDKVGFIERADGTCQLTVGGWPVYRFAKDTQPGDVLGQGVGGTWFAVTPDGKKASADAQPSQDANQGSGSASEAPESNSGGYTY
ncbi:MAG: hypothetical protein HOQ05_10105 [Corynebacteriales bacterium]|nr:hypothetical protein [Mycobacteriales bacterium]